MFRRSDLVLLVFLLIILIPVISVQAINLTCRSNLTYASDYYTCGNDLADKEAYEEALLAFRTARSMDERFYDEHFGISYQIGWLLNRLGRYEEALAEFGKAEKYHPAWINDFVIYYNEGCLEAKLGRYEEALKRFDQSLTVQYWNRYAWFNKGHVLARLERYDEAREAFDKARKSYGSFVPLLGSYREAANTYDRAAGRVPVAPAPLPVITRSPAPSPQPAPTYVVGLSTDLELRKANDFSARYLFEDAVRTYDQILVNDPSHYRAMEGKGVALANLGRFDEALVSLDKATLYLDYRVHESYYIDAWFVKGWVLANLDRYDEALDAFNKALMVDPDFFTAHYNKAWVLAKKGQYTQAAAAYNRSLEWEKQVRLERKTGTILGPLGDYKDAADIIDTEKIPGQVQTPARETLIYQTDFSTNPGWQTNRPRNYYWDSHNGVYYFASDENPGFAEFPVRYNGTSFRLEYDITIRHADPGTTALFGLAQHNTTYNQENAVLAEFRSWKSGMYRNVKDGEKSFQIIAIDALKHTTNEQYQGFCRINREDDRTLTTFGENRMYHVVVQYDRDNNLIQTWVTDNLHEKNYYVCSGIWYDIGLFRNMDRLILVVRQGENARIEGFIDNVKIYLIDTASTPPPVIPPDSSGTPEIITMPLPEDTTPAPTPTGDGNNGGGLDVMMIALPLLVSGIAGTGVYLWHKSRTASTPEMAGRRARKLQQSVQERLKRLEFFAPAVQGLVERSDNLIGQEEYQEAETLLRDTESKIRDLEGSEQRVRQWKNEGFEISPLITTVNTHPDLIVSAFSEFEHARIQSREVQKELDRLTRDHTDVVKDPEISRRIEFLRQTARDAPHPKKTQEGLNEVRALVLRHEEKRKRGPTIRDLLDKVSSESSGIVIFSGFIQSRIHTAKIQAESEQYETAFATLNNIGTEITQLKEYEERAKTWKNRGYSTKKLETAQYNSLEDIKTDLEKFNKKADTIRNAGKRLEELKNTHRKVLSAPRFASLVSLLEEKMSDPEEAVFIENGVLGLEEQISPLLHAHQEAGEKIRSALAEIRSSHVLREATRNLLVPVEDACGAEEYVLAERLLAELAAQNIRNLKKEIGELRQEGAIFIGDTGHLDALMQEKKYPDVILETERCFEKTMNFRQIFTRATSLRSKTTDPGLLEVYDQGKYDEFIRRAENRNEQQKKTEAARAVVNEILLQAENRGTVPLSVYSRINSSDLTDLEIAAEELRNFQKTAKPHLHLTLDRQAMEAHVWHKVNIIIENRGDAHALDVNFNFSREFETRWIRPKSIGAGKQEIFENIAIYPNIKGEVPLEISLTYHDAGNVEYTENQEFFINVTDSALPYTPPYTPQQTPQKIPSAKELPPEIAHMFTAIQYIGRGGFARVYKAARRDGKNVAIKVPISIDPSTGRTFVAEIQNWTKMVHENIVKVYEYNIMPPYFEMELCDESLANLSKPMQNEKAAWLAFSICEGLKYAHSQNVIHRDLKPQNILLKNGIPKISDWGLSRVMATQSTTAAPGSFTLYYAAPEQVNNRKQDARTDLWQMGVIFYELTTGALPFWGDTVTDTIIAIATRNPGPPSSINPGAKDLDPIVMRCLEKDPARRYQSVLELQKDIGEFLKMNYSNSLNESLITRNYGRSADYCGDLLLVNMKLGGIVGAYKYAADLAQYVSGDVKTLAEEFAEQIRTRMEMNLVTIPDELINKAEILVHKIKFQRK